MNRRQRTTRTAPAADRRGGFSLIDVLVATTLISLGVVAILSASASGTRTTDACRRRTEAVFLAQEIREWTLRLPFSDTDEADAGNPPGPDGSDPQNFVDDLDDLMDVTFSPPRDGQGSPLADMAGWSETVTLTWRNESDLRTTVSAGTSNVIHVQLDLSWQGAMLHSVGWFVAEGSQ